MSFRSTFGGSRGGEGAVTLWYDGGRGSEETAIGKPELVWTAPEVAPEDAAPLESLEATPELEGMMTDTLAETAPVGVPPGGTPADEESGTKEEEVTPDDAAERGDGEVEGDLRMLDDG